MHIICIYYYQLRSRSSLYNLNVGLQSHGGYACLPEFINLVILSLLSSSDMRLFEQVKTTKSNQAQLLLFFCFFVFGCRCIFPIFLIGNYEERVPYSSAAILYHFLSFFFPLFLIFSTPMQFYHSLLL